MLKKICLQQPTKKSVNRFEVLSCKTFYFRIAYTGIDFTLKLIVILSIMISLMQLSHQNFSKYYTSEHTQYCVNSSLTKTKFEYLKLRSSLHVNI